MRQNRHLCRLHPDFHIPADIDVGEGFDGLDYVRNLKEHGCDSVVFFAKCHYGHSYYPTEIGTPHPGLKSDMLGEVAKGCREHGLGMTAYCSVFLDSVAAEQHPDWRIISESDRHGAGFDSGNFKAVCVNSPYITELFLPQAEEFVQKYDIDEVFYDTMSRFFPCYCRHCREKFGRDIPETEDDPVWHQYVRWYKQCFDDFFAEAARSIHATKPEVGCVFNWKWGIREPSSPPPHITGLASDCRSSGNTASRHCRYYAGTELPFDFMCGRFLHGLGEWDNSTFTSMKYTASGAVANGGSFYLIDRQLPDGTLEPRAYEMMDEVFGFINERRDVLTGIRHVPEIGVVYSERSLHGGDLRDFPRSSVREDKMKSIEGISNLFSDNCRHYTVISESTFQQEPNKYSLIIVPEQNELEPETEEALRQYAEDGGALIISQSDSCGPPSTAIMDLAGLTFEGFTETAYGYTATKQSFHTRGHFALVRPRAGTDVYLKQIEPLGLGKGGKKFGHGMAPPGEVSEFPAVTVRGEGKTAYIAFPAFSAYGKHQSPYLRDMVLELVDELYPNPVVRAETPAQVEVVTARRKDDLIVNIVNHSGKEKVCNWVFPVTEYMPEIRDIEVSILGEIGSVTLAPSGTSLTPRQNNGRSVITLPGLHFMETVVVENYFKGQV